jgi:acetyl esterase
MAVQSRIVLEPSAQGIVDATSMPPFLYELEPAAARKVLEDLQAAPVDKLPVEEEWITVPADVGDARVRIIKPVDSSGTLPVIVYMHGGGWILGNAATHDRLVRELAVGARAALLFVEYPNSPEARYPVAIEQGYATAQWVAREGATKDLDASRMAVAGESVGGNMAAALTLMAKQRGDVTFVQTSMYYPVTDAAMDTASYDEFAEGYYLTRKAMEWFWDAYTTDPDQRAEITASPNQATTEQLKGLPPTLLLVDEADPLRDEGEAYAAKLRLAGVPVTTVRYDGVVHDFMLLNAMTNTEPGDDLAGKLKRTELQHATSSIPGREIVQVLTEIPAGVESGWHQHPGEEVGYIVAGTVRMEIEGKPTLTLHAGDPFLMPPRTPHNATDLGPDTGQMLSTYIVEVGEPIARFTR